MLMVDFLGELAPHTLGGVTVGHASPASEERAATQGINLSGYGLGVGIYGRYPVLRERVFVLFNLDFDYLDANGAREDQATDYEWTSVLARLGLGVRAGRFELRGGATARKIDGTERTRGDINDTTDFENDRVDSAFFELDFSTDPQGYIGLTIENGGTDGANLYFRRFF